MRSPPRGASDVCSTAHACAWLGRRGTNETRDAGRQAGQARRRSTYLLTVSLASGCGRVRRWHILWVCLVCLRNMRQKESLVEIDVSRAREPLASLDVPEHW